MHELPGLFSELTTSTSQQSHAYLRQQVDLIVGGDPAQRGGTGQNAHDEGDDQRLAQAHGNRPGQRRDQQQAGEFEKNVGHVSTHVINPVPTEPERPPR